ncbi:hypothetical protein C8J56DRAFT_1117062 [Mycena floridula]|nr:hypothetical protein C8J56DRAFT_1117062 [Mycena floridula]
MSESQQLKRVIVVGAGVVGLTTALKIQEHGGYAVTILAEVLPTDTKMIKYTSQWAGAQHGANTKDVIKRHLEKETFDIMWELSAPGAAAENCFMRIKEINYYPGNWSDEIDDPKEFLAKGGHISQVVEGAFTEDAGRPAAVVVCTGLGARFLGGIEDKDMYLIRGQTLYPKPRPETREKILKHAFDLYPELEDVDIVEDGCSLRPARKGGIWLEVDSYKGVPLVFNYGHGGYGFQSSWGSATIALKLLDGTMKKGEA